MEEYKLAKKETNNASSTDSNGRITESFNGSFETIQSRSNTSSSEPPHQQDEDSSEPSEISADTISEITSSSSASEAIISTVISSSITSEEPGAVSPSYPPGVKFQVKCWHKFRPEQYDELCLEVGDVANVLDDGDEEKEGWFLGYKQGEEAKGRGYFPKNHVDIMRVIETACCDDRPCDENVKEGVSKFHIEPNTASSLLTTKNRKYLQNKKQLKPGLCWE